MKEQIIERIPIAQIHIANPRRRSRGRWQMMVANIREVGLKKPITVVRRSEQNADGEQFDLVCGQGRIEAFLALGETTIPAIIAEAPREDQFLMSLVENIARRPPSNRDILREVRSLRERGYNVADIARKIGMERMYISGIVHLGSSTKKSHSSKLWRLADCPLASQFRSRMEKMLRFPKLFRRHTKRGS